METETALTQDIQNMQIANEAATVPLYTAPPGLLSIPDRMMQEFVEAEVIQHLDTIRANLSASPSDNAAEVRYPTTWVQLKVLLSKLAYDVETEDPWRRLGLARFEGPDPTAAIIAARLRATTLLCGLAAKAGWTLEDQQTAEAASSKFKEAADRCEELLPVAMAERKKFKASKLPLYKE